ncbi:hypothetical protein E4T43_05806 [Aureobasidium subglaciale]|nr:hypothetical protein E4T43_05806 [Aureobasidium subglaciale]
MSGIRTKREKHVVYALSIHHQDLREERHSIEDRVQEWEGREGASPPDSKIESDTKADTLRA